MYCPYCGAAVPSDKEVCDFCHRPLHAQGGQGQAEQAGSPQQGQPAGGTGYYQSAASQTPNQGGYYQNQAGQYQAQGQQPYGAPQAAPKSRLAAGLLQIFLGYFGVGRFYLGYTGIAVAQLLACIFTCGLASLWPLIDGILIITGTPNVDANGVPLRD